MSLLRKAFLVSVGVLGGFAGGLIVSGRLSATQAGSASPAAAPPAVRAAAPVPAVVAMPDLSPIAERAIQASVNISSTQYLETNPWFRAMGGNEMVPQTSLGSGVIVSADGYVLTNS